MRISDSKARVKVGTGADFQPRSWKWHAQRVLVLARRKPLGAISAIVLLVLVGLALLAPFISPFDPQQPSFGDIYHSPSYKHWFGTDELGRDVLSRIMYGSRISLYVGFGAVSLAVMAGTLIGSIGGYFGGIIDAIIQRIVDSWMAFPALVLAMTLRTVLDPSVHITLLVIAIVMVPLVARIARGATLAGKNNVYVEAAGALGASHYRIMLVHIFPNIVAPVIVIASLLLGSAIILEASLAFLGLGAPPNIPSWGNMIRQGRDSLQTAWWLAAVPGLAISVAVFSLNLLGDAVRDLLDPKLHGLSGARFG